MGLIDVALHQTSMIYCARFNLHLVDRSSSVYRLCVERHHQLQLRSPVTMEENLLDFRSSLSIAPSGFTSIYCTSTSHPCSSLLISWNVCAHFDILPGINCSAHVRRGSESSVASDSRCIAIIELCCCRLDKLNETDEGKHTWRLNASARLRKRATPPTFRTHQTQQKH